MFDSAGGSDRPKEFYGSGWTGGIKELIYGLRQGNETNPEISTSSLPSAPK